MEVPLTGLFLSLFLSQNVMILLDRAFEVVSLISSIMCMMDVDQFPAFAAQFLQVSIPLILRHVRKSMPIIECDRIDQGLTIVSV